MASEPTSTNGCSHTQGYGQCRSCGVDLAVQNETLRAALAASELVRGQMTSRALAYEAGLREIAALEVSNCDMTGVMAESARRTLKATEWPPPSATAAPAGKCQHQIKRESQKCRHGFFFGSTCDLCIAECAECRTDLYGLPAAPAEKRDGCSECADRQCYRLLSPGDGDEVDPTKPVPCPTCGNNPAAPAEEPPHCDRCNSSGVTGPELGTCPYCNGSGRAPSRGEVG